MDRIVPLKHEETVVKRVLALAVILGCGMAAAPCLRAQAPAQSNTGTPAAANAPTGQQKPGPPPQNAPPAGQNGGSANPFPEDESTVPVLPAKNTPDVPSGNDSAADLSTLFPAGDMDPVRGPDSAGGEEGSEPGFSSSNSGVDSLLPPPGSDTDADTRRKHGKSGDDAVPQHQETAAEDENVGKYYLDNKNWRAALSRFESALVLDPDNPDVYWGLAESQRHLGQFADARANYQKVMEYDPGSRHAKDAKKALAEPDLANAKPSAASNTTPAK
jgi:tetratricopeptide (TPR) repeat protein